MKKDDTPEAVVAGCSAGGLKALNVLLPSLDAQLAVPVIIVAHTGSEDIGTLCDLLARVSSLPVQEAQERHLPRPGCVYLAPTGYHLYLEQDGRFALSIDAKVCHVRPSIDVLFESAADAYGPRLIGVVMTGANEDGAAGMRAIRRRDGIAIVQEPQEAEVSTMPAAALAQAGADYCVPLSGIGPLINKLCRK
jgi:two-component system chemotaxis response regulator CheB